MGSENNSLIEGRIRLVDRIGNGGCFVSVRAVVPSIAASSLEAGMQNILRQNRLNPSDFNWLAILYSEATIKEMNDVKRDCLKTVSEYGFETTWGCFLSDQIVPFWLKFHQPLVDRFNRARKRLEVPVMAKNSLIQRFPSQPPHLLNRFFDVVANPSNNRDMLEQIRLEVLPFSIVRGPRLALLYGDEYSIGERLDEELVKVWADIVIRCSKKTVLALDVKSTRPFQKSMVEMELLLKKNPLADPNLSLLLADIWAVFKKEKHGFSRPNTKESVWRLETHVMDWYVNGKGYLFDEDFGRKREGVAVAPGERDGGFYSIPGHVGRGQGLHETPV